MYVQIIPFGIPVWCSSLPWGIWFLVRSSHPLDLVVVTYFLDACSVLSGMWCGLDVGLILNIYPCHFHISMGCWSYFNVCN
jgi:hypothetical protein